MIKNKYTKQFDCTGIDWVQVSKLFELVGWGIRSPEIVASSFEKSTYVCFIKEKDKIIAFGRTVDDNHFYGLIVDVVVHPDYQKEKIGSFMIDYLKSKMEGYSFITLTAAPGKDGFYEKLGWKRQKSAFIWPKDKKQEKDHCF